MNIKDMKIRAMNCAPGLILMGTAMGVAACGARSDEGPSLPIHIVCKAGDGSVMLDDYADEDSIMNYTSLRYKSRTTGRNIRAYGPACVALEETQPAGWKPIIPGRS